MSRYNVLPRRAGIDTAIVANGSGTLPPDGVDVWHAMVSGGASPRTEAVLNIDEASAVANRVGAIRVGDYKLITGASPHIMSRTLRACTHACNDTHAANGTHVHQRVSPAAQGTRAASARRACLPPT